MHQPPERKPFTHLQQKHFANTLFRTLRTEGWRTQGEGTAHRYGPISGSGVARNALTAPLQDRRLLVVVPPDAQRHLPHPVIIHCEHEMYESISYEIDSADWAEWENEVEAKPGKSVLWYFNADKASAVPNPFARPAARVALKIIERLTESGLIWHPTPEQLSVYEEASQITPEEEHLIERAEAGEHLTTEETIRVALLTGLAS